MEIPARVAKIRDRIERACRRSGRPTESVTLVAVSKTRTVEEIRAAVEAGITDVGENRVQEAEAKAPELADAPLHWHLVGHLQKNKAKKAVEIFDVIHSVDSFELGQRIDRLAEDQGKRQRVLVQVDLAQEATKHGLPEESLNETLGSLRELRHVSVDGLMVLPPYYEETEDVRPFFRRLRELGERAREDGFLDSVELSMGMSHDFEVAVEEGATLVRVGTAIFGERPAYAKQA